MRRLRTGEIVLGSILVLLIIGLIISLTFYIRLDVDENEFCYEKMQKEFPEYKFIKKNYVFEEKTKRCLGYYSKEIETRDGLRLVEGEEILKFDLIDKDDIKYLGRDDYAGGWSVILLILLFLLAFLFAGYYE